MLVRARVLPQSVSGLAGPDGPSTGSTSGLTDNTGSCLFAILGPSGAGEAHTDIHTHTHTHTHTDTHTHTHTHLATPSNLLSPEVLSMCLDVHICVCVCIYVVCVLTGKTTLLDILSGRRYGPRISGEVRVNGRLMTPLELARASG